MFNQRLAQEMFGVTNESDLRSKLYGTWSDLTPDEAISIIECLEKFENPKYCEIGVYFGGNFKNTNDWLRENKENFHMYGVDLFEDLKQEIQNDQTHDLYNKWNMLNVAVKEELEQSLDAQFCKNFTLVKGSSDKATLTLPEKCDVFFIDGNHTYDQSLADAEACIKMANPGAYLVFHNASTDIQPDPQYVERDGGPWAVCEMLSNRENLTYVKLVDRCAIMRVEDV